MDALITITASISGYKVSLQQVSATILPNQKNNCNASLQFLATLQYFFCLKVAIASLSQYLQLYLSLLGQLPLSFINLHSLLPSFHSVIHSFQDYSIQPLSMLLCSPFGHMLRYERLLAQILANVNMPHKRPPLC